MNSTTLSPIQLPKVVSYSLYSLIGSFVLAGNGLIVWIVARNRNLRKKEYIIPAGVAIGDFLCGFGYVSSGLKRLHVVLTRQENDLVTSWYCMWEAWTLCFTFGGQMMSLMIVFVSIDRLIATSRIATYMKLGIGYAVKGTLLVVAYSACASLTAIISSYYLSRTAKYKRTCEYRAATPSWFCDYTYLHQFFAGVISIFIYIAIMLTMCRNSAKIEQNKIKAEFKKRQLKVTRMLALVISSGFFLHDLPMLMGFVIHYKKNFFGHIGNGWTPLLKVMPIISSANNIIIYIVKNREIRTAVWSILRVRQTADLVVPINIRP